MSAAVEKQLGEAIEVLKAAQKEHSKATNLRSQFESQLQENTLVKQELSLVKEGGKVFKLIGPTLVPQDLVEARSNVDKRIEYIKKEIERADKNLKDLSDKENAARDKCIALQRQIQEAGAGKR
eukprot:m.14102 g.14102  ORF g.14102 m.14102 type:complete len:124 (+) comp6337_c1_seq1:12-383(+)